MGEGTLVTEDSAAYPEKPISQCDSINRRTPGEGLQMPTFYLCLQMQLVQCPFSTAKMRKLLRTGFATAFAG